MRTTSSTIRTSAFLLALGYYNQLFGNEIVNEKYGFRFEVPKEFEEFDYETPKSLITFIRGEKGNPQSSIFLRISRVGKLIDPTKQPKLSETFKKMGFTYKTETRTWQGIELRVLNIQDVDKKYVIYTAPLPLANEAVELQVEGPVHRKQEILDVFDESIRSFKNLKPFVVKTENVTYRDPRRLQYLLAFLLIVLPV